MTPVIIHPIVKPLKRVIKSPSQGTNLSEKDKIPPPIRPNPAPNSPYATNHQTIYGKLNNSASSIVTGIFASPCWINTIERGNLSNQ